MQKMWLISVFSHTLSFDHLFQEQNFILSHWKWNLDSIHWNFISCDKNINHAVCVNNMANPKMKSFNSYVFVHEARHEFFLQLWKTTFLHKSRLLLYKQLWWNLGPSLTININRELTCEFILANLPSSWVVLY